MMASQGSCWSHTFGSTGLFEQRRGSAGSIIRLLSSAFCLLLPNERVVLVDRVSIKILLRVLLSFIISRSKVRKVHCQIEELPSCDELRIASGVVVSARQD
ncbi:hypothetical protein OIDMADRAFT_18111 [Oidiodendron maius Zn]|uniref:Uncharacterized protein n=1 Tax=Oidiodendron maius (strain Zn) TaxID=913774 RepID=A0A0C3DPG1_OIDMZ|nr:hypothetical protein OIDMADRAFT_18111 [Oidiodendron maius Zn]